MHRTGASYSASAEARDDIDGSRQVAFHLAYSDSNASCWQPRPACYLQVPRMASHLLLEDSSTSHLPRHCSSPGLLHSWLRQVHQVGQRQLSLRALSKDFQQSNVAVPLTRPLRPAQAERTCLKNPKNCLVSSSRSPLAFRREVKLRDLRSCCRAVWFSCVPAFLKG